MGCTQSSSRALRKGNVTTPPVRRRTSAIIRSAQQGNKKLQKHESLENCNPSTDTEVEDFLCRGQRHLAKGRKSDAFEIFCKARDIMEERTPDSLDLATIYYELGRMLLSKNQNEVGTAQLKKALIILEDVPPCHEAAQVLNVLSTSPVVSLSESLVYRQQAEDIINQLQYSSDDEEPRLNE
eukprot:TRINITY_DN6060_c7_g1_i1.p1 TRINITY_DN6060_c7_g1~~TRINITY_DN6060_c7_g1_i1.p1  ORF type:complete len:182 (+),score=26.02 TRINITY_DN6060_c7_g1_i1:58-603(+)